MRRILPLSAIYLPGIAASFLLRAALPSQSGWTWTSPNGTHFYGWNMIGFGSAILLTAAMSIYVCLRKR